MDTIEWAKEHGQEFSWTVNLDNYSPTRHQVYGTGWSYDGIDAGRGPGIIQGAVSVR